MKRITIVAMLLIFILGMMITHVNASSKAIKQRMIKRLPEIKALKDQGIVGENNKGYLEFECFNLRQPFDHSLLDRFG